MINRQTFDEGFPGPGLAELNESIAAFHKSRPSLWSLPLESVRKARREGAGVFAAPRADPAAREASVQGRGGHAIPLRILTPQSGTARGTYLHFHGGGWVFGEPVENDERLRALCEEARLAVVSVGYRLAPEHPFPAAPEDCEDAALALAGGRIEGVPAEGLLIGGESAGAHLAVLTLVRLRDGHGLAPFRAANLIAGCYDLSLTPSARNWGEERLVLNTEDLKELVLRFVPESYGLHDPKVSPLFADLKGLPPALFTVGTRDPLLDDTLFMATRWLSAGNAATLSVWTGGCHVFQFFDAPASRSANAEATRFLMDALGEDRAA
ncbi:alpha/beta hydrolase [Aureimonas populi]|uniref:Alpha/beta hydrolase n=1 Tax=Aureimonas populi TaxID=1701758 RepID=A0ABW5CIH4_9HYPH